MHLSYYILAWVASIFYAFEAIAGKLTSKYSVKNPWLFNFIWAFLILLLTVPLAFYYHVQLPHAWSPLLLAGLFYAIGGTLYLLGIYLFDISAFVPLFNFRSVFAVILSALILKEFLSLQQYILILVIFFMGILVTMDERFSLKSFFTWPMLIIMADMIGLSFEGIFVQKSVLANGYWTTTLGVGVVMQLLLLGTIPLFWREIKSFSLKQFFPVLSVSATGFVATLAANQAYSQNVGISSTIIALPLSLVAAFLFSRFSPKLLEHHSNKVYFVRFTAAGIMLIAALKLAG